MVNAYYRDLVEHPQLEYQIMTIIGVLVTVILLNEFPGRKISKKVILNNWQRI